MAAALLYSASPKRIALDGRDRFQRDEAECDGNPVQNDWNGSAKVALISPVCIPLTGVVVIWKDLLVAPAGIVKLAGVLAEDSVSLRLTTRPPSGAGLEMFTLPVTLLQPATVV